MLRVSLLFIMKIFVIELINITEKREIIIKTAAIDSMKKGYWINQDIFLCSVAIIRPLTVT